MVLASLATLVIVVAVLALAITLVGMAASYRRPRKGLEVIQTGVAGFRFDMLLDRQPILVAEPVASLDDLLRAWFRWNSVGPATTPPPSLQNAAKFLVVHHIGPVPNEQDSRPAVEVTNPAHPEEVLRVIMPPRSVLIVPYLWSVQPSPPEAFAVVPVDDLVTRALRLF